MINELRINNYILGNYTDYGNIDDIEKQEICKVLALDSVGVAEHSIWVEGESSSIERYDSFEGIPLTEEWLLNLGFDKHSNNPFWFKKKQLCISLVGAVELISWDIQIFKIDTKINFVHQLQNLYFSLTNEELVYNVV